jgi:putative transposase
MAKKRFSEAEIIAALKRSEAGLTYEQIGRELGVSKHTISAWKAKYGGMSVSEAQRLRQLQDENSRLKKLVAELSLDKEMLKDVITKNGWGS